LLAPGAAVEKLADGFTFLEGPAADAAGNVYFTDVRENRIHRYSVDRELSIVREDTGGANGLAFDPQGHLIACAGGERQLLSFGNVSRAGASEVVVLAERFDGKKLNSPNDLWIDAAGGIYFTDPRYGGPGEPIEQDGEHVYYLTPDRTRLQRVADDLTKPNGIIGSRDGKTLYVASTQPQQTYAYVIGENGTLSGKRIFAEQGSDGVTLDERGNLYLTWLDGVSIYSPSGEKLETIAVPEWAANVAFGGPDHSTLFITARTGLYAVRMSVRGQRADR
jgi:gluconolactonase